VTDFTNTIRIDTHRRVNGFPFGAPPQELIEGLGPPDNALENYTGELEMLYVDSIYRFYANRFVECTLPATCRFVIDGVPVLSVFDWLLNQQDTIDKARFRVSLAQGMAYDFRDPEHGSLTIFEPGRWDMLLNRT